MLHLPNVFHEITCFFHTRGETTDNHEKSESTATLSCLTVVFFQFHSLMNLFQLQLRFQVSLQLPDLLTVVVDIPKQ